MLCTLVTMVTHDKQMTFPLDGSPRTFAICVWNKAPVATLPSKAGRHQVIPH